MKPTLGTWPQIVFALTMGVLLALAPLKFGNPIILDSMIPKPSNFAEWLIQSWPLVYGYRVFFVVLAVGIVTASWNRAKKHRWLYWMPIVWLAWQGLAALGTIDRQLSDETFRHFAVCVFLFYLGWHNPMNNGSILVVFGGILLSFIVILRLGFDQHFGGLAETERQFFLYYYPKMKNPPLDLIKRMKTTRIFSTLFYPNTLAALILLLLPMFVGLLVSFHRALRTSIRLGLGAVLVVPACACLFWSGSKAGWLIFLALGVVLALHSKLSRQVKYSMVALVCLVGLTGFFIRNKAFFERGATSVGSRFTYWEAAWKTGLSHPVLGTGPGTFGRAYNMIRSSGAEPAKMAHNDYLEQWSDSGLPGFLSYFALIAGSLTLVYRESGKSLDNPNFWIWLGLLGLALHSVVEFHLYIPGLAWPMFFFLGRQTSLCQERDSDPSSVIGRQRPRAEAFT